MAVPSGSSRNFISMQQKYDRVILLVDMDCFYCQVEEKLDPELKGKPLAVVQYNAWRGGGIIAVNYEARAKGVTRHMRGDEAMEQCPDIQLVRVPNVREKADTSKYREAGKEVANVLQKFTSLLERASVDEAYLDITESVNKRLSEMNAGSFTLQPQELIDTYAVGYERFGDYLKVITSHFANPYFDDDELNRMYEPNDIPSVRQSDVRLLLGASIASEIRAAVKASTGYECSAGIGHNKIIAKLACGMNKPNKQTILPLGKIEKLFETLPLGKIKGLGGKFGEDVCERLNIKTLGQILKYTENELQKKFDEKNGSWLYYISQGIDLEAVTPRFYSKSIGCCKKFPGRNNISGLNTLKHWLNELATEIIDRLEKDISENNRRAKQMTISYIQEFDGNEVSSSRSVSLSNYELESLVQRSFDVIKSNTKQFFRQGSETVLNNPIKFLGISVGKFETILSGQSKLQEMFANQATKKRKQFQDQKEVENNEDQEKEKNESTAKLGLTLKSSNSKNIAETTKMKGNLAKFLQTQFHQTAENQQSVKPDENNCQQNIPCIKVNESVVYTTDDADNKETPALKIVNSHEASLSAASIESVSKPTVAIKSFFMNALNKSKATKVQSPPKEVNRDLVESLKLQPQIDDTEKEEIISNSNLIHDSYGSPNKKRVKLSPTSTEKIAKIGSAGETEAAYHTQYAEYALPELNLDLLEFQKCELCSAKIPVDERAQQMHRDQHFAQELSQQQRNEFRNEIKTKLNQPKPKSTIANKTNQKKSPSSMGITRFLKPKTSVESAIALNELPTTSNQIADTVHCKQCDKLIRQCDWTEHEDYHIAKQLQRELNQLNVHTVMAPSKKTTHQTGNKKSLAGQQKSATKAISEFFVQSQTMLED